MSLDHHNSTRSSKASSGRRSKTADTNEVGSPTGLVLAYRQHSGPSGSEERSRSVGGREGGTRQRRAAIVVSSPEMIHRSSWRGQQGWTTATREPFSPDGASDG
jgi:hypothetical protein